jgi:hypothetical protein
MRVDESTRAVISSQLSCNFCSCLTGARKLWKLSCKLSLLNSHQLSCNFCSCLIRARELGKLSCKLSLLNSHQLSCNSCSRLIGARELGKLSCKLSLLNSHATLVLVWSGHESWENSHACKLSTLINTHSRLTRTLLNRYECTWVRGCSLVCPCLGNTYSSASYNYKVQLYIHVH